MTSLAAVLGADFLPSVTVELANGEEIAVARLLRREVRLSEPISRASSCWAPNKPTLLVDDRPSWAEFAIVRQFERAGWEARWIKNWTGGRETCIDVGRAEPMPKAPQAMFDRIDRQAASRTRGGAWDVFAWRDDRYLILESKKHRSGDALRPGQAGWLGAGLAVGLPIDAFAIVEYEPLRHDARAGAGSAPRPTGRGGR